jgi:hypothetical protein
MSVVGEAAIVGFPWKRTSPGPVAMSQTRHEADVTDTANGY